MHIGFIITDVILGLVLLGLVIYKLIPKSCPQISFKMPRNLSALQQELTLLIKDNVVKTNDNTLLKKKIVELTGKINIVKFELEPYIITN